MQEYVFGLEVSVDHVVLVHVLDSRADLLDPLPHQLLTGSPVLLQVAVEVAPEAGLKHQVGRFLIHEEVIDSDDAGVVDEGLYLDLPGELLQGGCVQSAAVDRFDGVDHSVAVASMLGDTYCAR